MLPPIIFSGSLAFSWPDLRSLLLAAIHLSGRYAAPPVAAEIHFDDDGACCAHAIAIFRACEYALKLEVTNLLFLRHPIVF